MSQIAPPQYGVHQGVVWASSPIRIKIPKQQILPRIKPIDGRLTATTGLLMAGLKFEDVRCSSVFPMFLSSQHSSSVKLPKDTKMVLRGRLPPKRTSWRG